MENEWVQTLAHGDVMSQSLQITYLTELPCACKQVLLYQPYVRCEMDCLIDLE